MKKDPNYIAAVEKAIAEKYGKDTVQDFRSQWTPEREKEYLEQLKQARKKKEKKKKKNISSNRTCPTCKTYSFSSRDDLYMNRFECCYLCYRDFVQNEEDRWNDGWRPGEEHLNNALRRRKNGNRFGNS